MPRRKPAAAIVSVMASFRARFWSRTALEVPTKWPSNAAIDWQEPTAAQREVYDEGRPPQCIRAARPALHHAKLRGSRLRAKGHNPPAFKTCARAATMARSFERERRRSLLTFEHHAAVASLQHDQQHRCRQAEAGERQAEAGPHYRGAGARSRPRVSARRIAGGAEKDFRGRGPTNLVSRPISRRRCGQSWRGLLSGRRRDC
jgi:hypothetical protein